MKTQFTQILSAYVPSGSSDVALKQAVELCKVYDSKLTILNVNPKKSLPGLVKQRIEQIVGDQHFGFVEKEGRPFNEILNLEKAIDADLIVMGSHGSKTKDPDWIGGNAFKVLSKSTCPVLLLPEDYKAEGFKKIIVPLADLSETRQKVPLAVSIAEEFDGEVHILLVHPSHDEEVIYRLKIYAKQAQKYCEDRGVRFVHAEVFDNYIVEACLDYSKEVGADLLTIMSERESPTGFFMGNYAQELVNTATVPVLTIHTRDLRLAGEAGY